MERKIRVGAVSYLNTKPLVYGLEQGNMKSDMKLVYDYPSKIAAMLLDDEIDVGLVPVTVIPKLKEAHIISDYCIGADGPVASVCLFSEVAIQQVEKVLLDYQSRTSVALTKLLLKEYWNHPVEFVQTTDDYTKLISGTTAGLVIGDRALIQRKKSPFIYDLAEAWKHHTSRPFVFAAWISNKPLEKSFIDKFNQANSLGLRQIKSVVAQNPFPEYDLYTYYTKNISYMLTPDKKMGLELFLQKMYSLSL